MSKKCTEPLRTTLCTTHFVPWVHSCAPGVYRGSTHPIYTKINDFTAYLNASQRCFIPHRGTLGLLCTVYRFCICVYICVPLYTSPHRGRKKKIGTRVHTGRGRGERWVGIQGNIYIYIVIIVIYMYIGCVPMRVPKRVPTVYRCTETPDHESGSKKPRIAAHTDDRCSRRTTLTASQQKHTDRRAAAHDPTQPGKQTRNRVYEKISTRRTRANRRPPAAGAFKKLTPLHPRRGVFGPRRVHLDAFGRGSRHALR